MVITGSANTFSVVASAGGSSSGLGYQWRKNGVNISGATSASYTTPGAVWSDQNSQYSVVVTSAGGTVTSLPATLTLTLSTDQQLSESVGLATAGGSYDLDWNLNYVGSQSSTTNYLVAEYSTLSVSPLTNGPQLVQEQPYQKIATTLASDPAAPTRVLKNGVILVVPGTQGWYNISYVNSSVREDILASDGTTVAYSVIRSNFAVVPLSGALHSAPMQVTDAFGATFISPSVLDTTTNWATGAAYVTFTNTNLGNLYKVFDCQATTTDANVSACQTNTTLAAAMAAGETDTADGVTYSTANNNGTMQTIGGVPMWIANSPRALSSVGAVTQEYRIYFQLNGNVYTGSLIQDGATFGGGHARTSTSNTANTVYLINPTRFNRAAVQSLIAGSLL